MAARRRRRRRGYARRNAGRIVLCTFIEVIVICALVIMVGWNKGMKEWFAQFQQPILKEVDISGINSPKKLFYSLSYVHPRISLLLREVLLFREFCCFQ